MSAKPDRASGATALALAFAVAALVWVAVAWSSIHRDPGLGGWLGGILGGGFLALLVAAGGAWAAMTLVMRPAREEAAAALYDGEDDELGRLLADLETVRAETKRAINAKVIWRAPLGVLAAVVLWIGSQLSDDPADIFDLIMFMIFGAVAGYFWASVELGAAYRRRYKEQVLPHLAAGFGALTWRVAQPPLVEMRNERLFPEWDDCDADDEIFGEYRGLPLSIVEVKLTKSAGKNTRTIFHGLVAGVTLPRGLTGTTVVAPDRGMFGNMRERLRGDACQPVRLEDPVFEKAYEVYSTDQISARALLTPAFMERFMALAASGRFGAPAAVVHDNRLLMALASTDGRDLFEPPGYRKPAAGRQAITQLHDDIAAVLKAADAVIDLDQAARLQPKA